MSSSSFSDAAVLSVKTWKRKNADFYPTPTEVTFAAVEKLGLKAGARIVDPACGEGDLADLLKACGFDVEASDLRHTGYGEPGVDFLNPPDDRFFFSHDAMMTNPPFDIADKFIRTAYGQFGKFALLLKSNYWNVKSRLQLWDDCTPTGHHPLTWRPAFLKKERGNSPLMDCDWWFWDVEQPPMASRPLSKPAPTEVPDIGPRPLTVHLRRLARAFEDAEAARGGL